MKGLAEVKEKLGKFFIEVGKEEKLVTSASDLIGKIEYRVQDGSSY